MQTIRNAYKATIRGNLIAINAIKKKKEKNKLQEIQDLRKKEEELKEHPGKKKMRQNIDLEL